MRHYHFFWNQTFPEGLPPEFLYSPFPFSKEYGFPVPIYGNPPPSRPIIPQTVSCPAPLPVLSGESCLLLALQEGEPHPADLSPIPFSVHMIQRGDAILHTPGESLFLLKEPGVYEIFYSVNVSNADGKLPKMASVGLYLAGKPIPGSFWEETIVVPDQTLCISAATAVSATDFPVPLRLRNESSGVSYRQCTLLVHKIGN